MKNIRLDLSYDGTGYSGWQIQPNANTIESELRNALTAGGIDFKSLVASGRTDAGVHARNQVVSFYSKTSIPSDRIVYVLNRNLPGDIRVLNSQEVFPDFNAHNSAIGKTYSYYVNLNSFVTPFEDRYSWHFPYELNWDRLNYAVQFLEGKHDFVNFMSSGSQVKTTVRQIDRIKPEILESNILKLEYTGNGFLYNMVRILTGTIIEYSNSKITQSRFDNVFKQKDRRLTGITAPAKGLFLEKVFYSNSEKEQFLSSEKTENLLTFI